MTDRSAMASGGGEGLAGKKRKAVDADRPPARREPRRGLGVAALESIRAQLETVENFYVFPSFSTTPPSLLVPGARLNPYVGNAAVQRDYCPPQHYTLASRYLQQRQQASNAHAVPHHRNHLADQNVVAPVLNRHRAQAHGQMRRPKVAFVDLVDSDDDDQDVDPGAKEELDLELKL